MKSFFKRLAFLITVIPLILVMYTLVIPMICFLLFGWTLDTWLDFEESLEDYFLI